MPEPEQTSPVVQALPSLQVAPALTAYEHAPVIEEHVPVDA